VNARSFGIMGSVDPAVIRRLAPLVESAGYHALWINDTAGGDALTAIAAAAETTTTLGLASGVIPLDRESGAEIARRVAELGLPTGRLRIGIGSGNAKHGLALLERAVDELRAGVDAPIVIGGLGPRTRALAARIADGILLTRLTPETAADAMAELRRDANGRAVEGILYARTIADPAARDALAHEVARYSGIPAYAANEARLGFDPARTTVDLTVPGAAAAFDAVDELVLRAITPTGAERELVTLLEAGAPTRA
jgi:alkanesulfonate monooxygenase SsuD/methylene tetrahydromethanopterin reductase-like flavin-dependent oxidoreductase (luciferase family)